jgi:hypothetical protein
MGAATGECGEEESEPPPYVAAAGAGIDMDVDEPTEYLFNYFPIYHYLRSVGHKLCRRRTLFSRREAHIFTHDNVRRTLSLVIKTGC